MTDLESDINTLRELNAQRVECGRLRDEGKDALIALLEQDNTSLFHVGDITDALSLIGKLENDSNPLTQRVSKFLWGQMPRARQDLLRNPDANLSQRKSALIEELNRILQGTSIYESERFAGVVLSRDTRWLHAQNPAGTRLLRLNRLLLEDAYPLEIAKKLLDIFSDILPVSVALWELSNAPPQEMHDLMMSRVEHLKLSELVDFSLPILRAAKITQAIVAAPSPSFTQSLPYCYYLIIRELYTADSPDWALGGARAHPKDGTVSAYMTRECVNALLSLARTLENTGNFIAKVGAIHKRADQLRKMETSFPELKEWVSMERERLERALNATTRTSLGRLVLQPPVFTDFSFGNIDAHIEKIASQLKYIAENVETTFTKALDENEGPITVFRAEEERRSKMGEQEMAKFQRTEAGHLIAKSALERGRNNAQNILSKIVVSLGWYKEFKKWGNLEEGVKKIAREIRGLLHPVTKFLSSVLDSELAAAAGGSYGEVDAVEMACAAASYCAVTNEWDDNRLPRVVDSLKTMISDRGRFPIGRPFYVDVGNYHLPDNTTVIEALAHILKEATDRDLRLRQPITIPVEPALVSKLLYYFRDTRADKPVCMENEENTENRDKKGWRFEYTPLPSRTESPATATTVQSLALINRMLDEQINARILYYFTVKQPEELETNLDTLFYPDYGMPKAPSRLDRDSVAIFLQKMRVHVGGLRDSDTLYSLVLHGPQGTGKTTIAEALASSCEVPLVEITPSDIVVGGGEGVERRARTVFEALSLLTRVVILFDEFDPVLWSRSRGLGGRPTDVFAFLTASMLPKLKTLHKTAKIRSVAYILITNLIGSLDEPTIRKGRFDKKVGIYPPDVLSRAGIL